jgi:hypothetical protein
MPQESVRGDLSTRRPVNVKGLGGMRPARRGSQGDREEEQGGRTPGCGFRAPVE